MKIAEKARSHDFELGISGFWYSDLYKPEKLEELAEKFYQELAARNPEVAEKLDKYIKSRGDGFDRKQESAILTESAPYLSEFVAKLFKIEQERERLFRKVKEQDAVWQYKFFVQRRAIKKFTAEKAAESNLPELEEVMRELRFRCFDDTLIFDEELAVATITSRLLQLEEKLAKSQDYEDKTVDKIFEAFEKNRRFADAISKRAEKIDVRGKLLLIKATLEIVEEWSAFHFFKGDKKGWQAFRVPHTLDYQNLVRLERYNSKLPEAMRALEKDLRRRDGFKLTDDRGTEREALYEVNYCLICHERLKDSCSKGLRETDGIPKRNPLGIKLEGCPLGEKISEMHLLKRQGDPIAALTIIMIDNPMCPGTGHRICNDCMKACIFQKQEPVNIPKAETSVLTDVLSLPYGFEIYSLLTRWNPLNAKRPFSLPYNGRNVLVVGLGPAGYTLANYLLNEGFGVVGIDGLKIEPLSDELTGKNGKFVPKPIKDIKEITQELDERVLSGFGGVSEYGITVRWDKNFLTILQLTLARRKFFRSYGGVRFGGTLKIEDAWQFGFDHIAIATGAGRPTFVKMKNNLIRGIRKASDFLMALQLTGAFKKDTFSNLQIRLPAVVIGGGLTGIDTSTELFAYYPIQVEKILDAYEQVVEEFGEDYVWQNFDEEEKQILTEFLEHGRAVRAERCRAKQKGEKPNFIPLVRSWGGVSLVYRKRLQDSPAYRLNHEEVQKALEEGIDFVELMDPREAVPDEFGAVEAVIFERQRYDEEKGKFVGTGEMVKLQARTVCVAAGTSPNVIYERENPGTFKLDETGQYFLPHKLIREDGKLKLIPAKQDGTAFFTSYCNNGKFITYYGDNHPTYAGNVVKAMASAKLGYREISNLFSEDIGKKANEEDFETLIKTLDEEIRAFVVKVERLAPSIVEVIVKAPLQARKFKPGQFYRLQNFESKAPMIGDKKLLMEGLALTGAWTDAEKGLLSMIVLEMGVSSRLCSLLKPGEEVIVMGPTGTPTEIPEGETVMLVGGGLGNAVLFSIAKAMKEKGNRIIYFAGYKNGADLFKREEIESSTDQVIWATDYGVEIVPKRPQDAHFRGNIIQAMLAYAEGRLGDQLIKLSDVDRIIAIGSDRMMNAVKEARYTVLKPYLKENHIAIGSINSPMQCMMKEICAQCLQKHVNPHTGEEFFVFSCFNQDQNLDTVDFRNLSERLRSNSVQEKLSNMLLDKILKKAKLQAV
ncbi:MAG: FAD-dependent oxidoreductase [Pyrinomonadaceae bacterium]|nr:FAD-dependent oxidoreductase [Pyrinomonadaceae bacterium]MCX7639192.1 FAD-dependent oxidoreductase [Pyrinomonadaceae bacterium]MDW8303587.1 FAD-dependent oxidoreductase [Acidobacteriota bacterium]